MRDKTKEEISEMIYARLNKHESNLHFSLSSAKPLNDLSKRLELLEKFLDIKYVEESVKTHVEPAQYVSTQRMPDKFPERTKRK